MKKILITTFISFGLITCSSDEGTDVSAPTVTSILVADIANNGNGLDLEITFDKVGDESLIDEYRVFVVQSSVQSTFDLAAAENIPLSNYHVVPADGSNKKITLNDDSKDSGGQLITESTEYVIFVLSVADGIKAVKNSLSNPSSVIIIEQVLIDAPMVTNIRVADITNNGNGTDLEVSFNKVLNESLISEYRILVVRSSEQGSFDLTAAENVSSSNYFAVLPDGTNKKVILNADSNDGSGQLITESVEYVVFVLTVVDGTNATGSNSLSSSSTAITLMEILVDAPKVTTILIEDVANNGNGKDLEVYFRKVTDESLIGEYRLFVVKSGERGSFDLATAENAPVDNYLSLSADGSDKQVTFKETSKDINGQIISESVEYVVFVLSIIDGVNATGSNSLSTASASLSLDQSSIKITYIGNDGVLISDGSKSVIIDALPAGLGGWRQIANGIQSNIEQGNYPYNNISAAMVTHNHGDHVSLSSVTSFLQKNPSSKLLAPSQIRGGISGGAGQIENFNLSLDSQIDLVIDGIPIRVMRIRHFTPQNGADFSSSESLAYLIELGGKKILHVGDGDLSAVNFNNLGLENENIDVVLIPTFTFSGQLTNTNRDILFNRVVPKNIIGLHLATGTTVQTVTNLYPEAFVFTTSLQFIRY